MNESKSESKLVKSFWNERWALVETKNPTVKCDYYISDYGRIKSFHKETKAEKLLKGSTMKYGFIQLNLRLVDNGRQSIYVHKFVAENFIGKPEDPEKKFMNHLDDNKSNNHYSNLRWVTQKELTQIQIEKGVYSDKKLPTHTKMSESKVLLLLDRLKKGKTKRSILARNFGISETQLKRIESGENWGHLKK